MPSEYIIVQLTDYLFANGGVIAPDREVIFTIYETGPIQGGLFSSFYVTTYSCCGYPVTNVRMCATGYVGVKEDGSEMTIPESQATIKLPLSILKGA